MNVFVKNRFSSLMLTSAVVTSLTFIMMNESPAGVTVGFDSPLDALDAQGPEGKSVQPFIPVGSEFGFDFQGEDLGQINPELKGKAAASQEMSLTEKQAIEEAAKNFTGAQEDALMDSVVTNRAQTATPLSADDNNPPKTPSHISGFSIEDTLEMAEYAELSYYQPHFEAPDQKKTNFSGGMKNKEENAAFEARIKKLIAEGHTVRFFGTATENAGLIIERTDGRVIVSYHGTDTTKNLLTDANILYAIDKKTGGRFHSGFYQDFAQTAAMVETHLRQIAKARGVTLQELGKNITFTGHSLGASLATIAGYWFTEVYQLEGTHVAAFAPARAMDYTTALAYDQLMGNRTLTVSKSGDPVPYLYNATIFGAKHVGQRIHLPKNIESTLPGLNHHAMTGYTAAFAEMTENPQEALNQFQVYDAGWYFNPLAKTRLLADHYAVNPIHKGWNWLRGWEVDGLKAQKQDKVDTKKAKKLGEKISKNSFLKLSTPELEEMVDLMVIKPLEEDGLIIDVDKELEEAFEASINVKGGISALRKKLHAEEKAQRAAKKAGQKKSRWSKIKSSVQKKISTK